MKGASSKSLERRARRVGAKRKQGYFPELS